jgi:large subunit ribosomal protein L15
MPLQRRLPKRGFTNIFRKEYSIVNLAALDRLSESVITPEVLQAEGLVKSAKERIKILGDGDITRPITVKAHAFSTSAREKIIKAKGSIEII